MTTPLPKNTDILAHWSIDSLSALANGSNVETWTDSISGFAATLIDPTQVKPKIRTANGVRGIQMQRGANGRGNFKVGKPTALANAINTGLLYAVSIIFRTSPTPNAEREAFNSLFGFGADGTQSHLICNGSQTKLGNNLAYTYDVVPDEIHVVTWAPVTRPGTAWDYADYPMGRAYLDGTCIGAGNLGGATELAGGAIGVGIGNVPDDGNGLGFRGDILDVIFWDWSDTPDTASYGLTGAEVFQITKWASEKYGHVAPWTGQKWFPIFSGDSQAHASDTIWGKQIADSKQWKPGTYTVVGKDGNTVQPAPNGQKFNITDWDKKDVDGIGAIVGKPIILNWFEWHNRGPGGDDYNPGSEDSFLADDLFYNTLRKTNNPGLRIIQGTSTSTYDRDGLIRSHYNQRVLSDRVAQMVDLTVAIHTDDHIGINGAARADDAGSYFADTGPSAIHLGPAGDAILAAMWIEQLDTALAWPTTCTIINDISGANGSPVSLTFSLNGAAERDIVLTPHVTGATGAFSHETVTIPAGDTSGSVTFTPSQSGDAVFSTTNDYFLKDGSSPFHSLFLATGAPATIYVGSTVSGFTVALNGPPTSPIVWTPTATLAGNFSPASITLTADDYSGTYSFTPSETGTCLFSGTNNGGLAAPATILRSVVVQSPILGTVSAPADRLVRVPMLPGASQSFGLVSNYPSVWAAPLDPSDVCFYAADFGEVLAGETIDTILAVTINSQAAGLGLDVILGGELRPTVDRAANLIGLWIKGDPSQRDNTAFANNGIELGITIRFSVIGSPAIYERTVAVNVRQL